MIAAEPGFELLAPVSLNVVCFRYSPSGAAEENLNRINEILHHSLNDSGKLYLSHTTLNGKYTLRMVTGQTSVTLDHVEKAWDLIRSKAKEIMI
jgi:aromatic-L-amino-acid decarboxylase